MVVPLAVANLLQTPLIIYSSKLERPMESVQPDMKLGNVTTFDRIILAYLAIAGHEHYDACIKPLHLYLDESNTQCNVLD
jgi:hypothetical protein